MLTGLILILRITICQVTKVFLPSERRFVFTFPSSIELFSLLLFFFLRLSLFFGIIVKCFWQFGYVKFHSWCDYELAIIKPSACLLSVDYVVDISMLSEFLW